ncbi:sec-independent protein translocase protein TatB [Malonomonas rubra DSM 5091]|uniref:Multifunctional fusion protein n=1 Tax=Malonomonas rubra DSM 5091 TaxID=1122189 RepID=A0A1M6IJI5_MALRU|nr:Sec-independent protein translocase protein TatB [Malonomonas rubra]SHJ34588.1 sec-independent protein translocase protein TatB [Malonomonas rubra DSM 5091]
MFGIGMTEMLLIGALALIVLGPKKLPDLARSLGKGFAEFKRATNEFKNTMEVEIRAEEVRQTQEKLQQEGKLKPEAEVAAEPESAPEPEGNAEAIAEAKAAQARYAEEDAEIERQLEEEVLTAEAPQPKQEQKQDV